MKAFTTAAGTAVFLLAGCASFEPATPPSYTGPQAAISDQAVQVSSSLIHVFEMTHVDGRKLRGSGLATSSANQGRGFAIAPMVQAHDVPARPSRVQLGAATQYAAPILAMMSPTCRVQGEVAFAPEAGKTYRVAGRIEPAQCSVWIEDSGSQQPVTEKVVGKGTKS